MTAEKIYELEWKEKYVEGVKHFETIICDKQFAELHVLDMFYCEIGVEGAKHLKEMFISKPMGFLRELNFSGNALTDDGFMAIVDIIIAGALPNLIYINFDDNLLTAKSIQYLTKAYEANRCNKVQAISFNLNDLREEGAIALASIMKLSPLSWLKLNLNENHIGNEGFNALMDIIESREFNLNELSLSQNNLSTTSINRIGTLLSQGKLDNLLLMDLSYNYSEDALEGLFEGLEKGFCHQLRRLIISGMCMEATGCGYLRNVIKKKALPGLQELVMSDLENNIMEKGVLSVLLALRETSCPIRLLDLSWNNLTDEGAKYVINFLNGKSKIELAVILLHQNDIAFSIADLQGALNRRKIQSPKLREQWM